MVDLEETGKFISKCRRDKGFTQKELGERLHVTDRAVSKWETGQSFPDIALLPKLAVFFNISIDELMDFQPEMTQDEIRRFHRQTASEFTCRPFSEVIEKCRRTAQAYYSCFPLLFQIGSLMINHCSLAGSSEESAQILEEAAALFRRVRIESRDASLAGQALSTEAYCLISLRRPDEALDLLGRSSYPYPISEPLIASAWQMKGQPEKAAAELQAGIYQNIIGLMNLLWMPWRNMCDAPLETSFPFVCTATSILIFWMNGWRIIWISEVLRPETPLPYSTILSAPSQRIRLFRC